VYFNNQMPDVMQAAEKLAVATIFGTGSRFQFAAPKCRLSRDVDPDLGNVSFRADYMRFGQTAIAKRVNKILALGAEIVFRSTAPAPDAASAGRSKVPMLATWRLLMLMIVCVCAWRMTRIICRIPATILCCSDLLSKTASTRGYNQLAILGGPKSSGLWFAMPDNLYNCEDGELKSICGHYREWGLTPNDPDIKLGAAISIDVAAHRQVYAVNLVMLADRELSQVSLSVAEQTSPKKTALKTMCRKSSCAKQIIV
jgi:hypothetical protein